MRGSQAGCDSVQGKSEVNKVKVLLGLRVAVCYTVYACVPTHARRQGKRWRRMKDKHAVQRFYALADSLGCPQPKEVNIESLLQVVMISIPAQDKERGFVLLAPTLVYKSSTESGIAIASGNTCGDFKDMFFFILSHVQRSFGESYLGAIVRLLHGAVEVILGKEKAWEFMTKVKKELEEDLAQELGKSLTH